MSSGMMSRICCMRADNGGGRRLPPWRLCGLTACTQATMHVSTLPMVASIFTCVLIDASMML